MNSLQSNTLYPKGNAEKQSECHDKPIRYRTDKAYGDGMRDIVKVMTYEIYTLGNTDILDTLIPVLEDAMQSSADKAGKQKLIDETILVRNLCNDDVLLEDTSEEDIENLCMAVISVLEEKCGHPLRYCLWLADYNAVFDYYGRSCLSEHDIDAYETSDVILSDLGHDGALYAYEFMPEPLSKP